MKRIMFASALLITSLSFASLTDGLVGYWPFNGDAKDYSGNENDGNLHGVSFVNGRNGRAAQFGGNDYVSVPSSGKVSQILDFSVAAWIKMSRYETSSIGEKWCALVSKGGDSGRQFGVQFGVTTNSVPFYQLVAGDRLWCPGIPINSWTHIAVTRSGINTALYMNGVCVASGTSKSYPERHSGALEIGRDSPGDTEYFHGAMDDVCLYNRALSASEVSAIYNGGLKLGTVVFNANAVEVEGSMPSLSALSGTREKLPVNAFRRHDGYMFQGWALSPSGEVVYKDEALITVDRDMTLYAVWAPLADVVVHFIANGGVFKDKNGNVVEQFDQYFTYGEAQRLFTDELTPVRMDGNGNRFLGWSKGTPNIASSDLLFGDRQAWTFNGGVTEERFYAVWTTTVTVSFYNEETTSGNKSLSPSSLADHLRWSVDDGSAAGRKTLLCGESIEVCPGRRTIQLHCDDNYKWLAGKFGFAGHEPLLNMVNDTFELDIGNDFTDSSPRPAARNIFVKAEPESGGELKARVQFLCLSEIRESLRNRIRPEDVPFDDSKVRITIGRAAYNESGFIEPMNTGSMTGLEAYKLYPIPKGLYYVKDVSYNVDTSDGAPYWGAVLDSSLARRRFEVDDDKLLKEVTIRFDMFGGLDAARVELDPQGGECEKTEMWFEYFGGINHGARVNKKLPQPQTGKEGIEFAGWFTAKSGGQWKTEGSDISSCTLFAHWTKMTRDWVEENTRNLFPELAYLDMATVANTMSANGCRTVGECYALGIDPEDPNDDLKITDFKVKNGKPVITVNHTVDGSGNSFTDRIRTLGKKSLVDADWVDITDIDQSEYRFFKVAVEIDDDDGGSGGDGWGDGGDINLDDFVIEQGVLQRYVGEAANVVIPSCVTNIGEAAFVGNTNLVSVTIPDSVMSIGDWAFYGCMGLTSVTVPDSVTNVGDYAFGFCTELTTASLPVSLEGRLSDSVFCECPEELRIVYRSASADMRSINVNFTDGNALDGVNCAEELVGAEGYAVPCRVWDNVVGTNSVNRIRVYKESCGDLAGAADVSLEIAGSRGYWNCQDLAPSNSLLYAYVDDIVGSACPTLTASNIPFENCRVVIYASTDSPNAKFGHYTINGVNVTGNGSTFGTEHWGDAGPWYSAQPLAQGVNYVVSPVIALGKGGVLSIVTHNAQGATIVDNTRGTIAAIQIVETKETPVRRTVTFDLGEYGSRVGGGELVQMVAEGSAAVAPQVVVTNGLALIGWDADFSCVTNDLTVTARYAVDKYYGSSDAYGNALNPVLALTEGFAGLSNGWNVLNEEFRLNMSGNGVSADGKTLAIGDAGLELGFPRPFTNITVVVECESVAAADGLRGLFSVETAEYKNRVGVAVDAGGTISGYYNTVYANETSVTSYSQGLTYGMTLPLDGNKTYLAFHYDRRRANSPGNGVSVYCISPGTSTRCYYGFGLKFEVDNVSGICVGGAYGGVYAPMTGMTIRSLAVFEGDIAGGALNLGDVGTAVIPDYSASSAN